MTNFNPLLLISVLALSTEIMATPIGSSGRTESYDELQLVFQWPISYCNTHHCDYIPDMFTVHGLWPNRNSQWIDCSKLNPGIKYSLQIRPDLRGTMEIYWPNLLDREHPESFWLHEYITHGRCINEFQSQMDYFETAINITLGIRDVLRMPLSTTGKHLESRQSYQAKDFEFVTPGGRITPGLRCSTTNDGKIQLQEIVFCTDSNKRLKNCTANMCRMIPRQPRRRMCRMIPMPRHRMIPMPRQPRPGMCRMIPEPKWSATFIFP